MQKFVGAVGLIAIRLAYSTMACPWAFALATAQPEQVTAIVSQNGNAYEEGLTKAGATAGLLIGPDARETRRTLLTRETTKWQYTHGTPEPHQITPDVYWPDYALMPWPGNDAIQLDLAGSYASNVALYRASKPD